MKDSASFRRPRPVRRPYPHVVELARAFAAPLGLRDPLDVDVEAIAHRAGAHAVVPRRWTRGEGHLVRGHHGAIIAVREDVYGTPKGSFVILHEAGHLKVPSKHDALALCTGASIAAPPHARRHEGEANDFATAIAMSEAWFSPFCRGTALSVDDLCELSRHFRMSFTAVALRALLFVDSPSALVFVARGLVGWCAFSEGFEVYIHRKAAAPLSVDARPTKRPRVEGGVAWGDVERDLRLHQSVFRGRGSDVALVWLTHRSP